MCHVHAFLVPIGHLSVSVPLRLSTSGLHMPNICCFLSHVSFPLFSELPTPPPVPVPQYAGKRWPYSNWQVGEYEDRLASVQESVFENKIQCSTRSEHEWALLHFKPDDLGIENQSDASTWRLYYDAAATLSLADRDGFV